MVLTDVLFSKLFNKQLDFFLNWLSTKKSREDWKSRQVMQQSCPVGNTVCRVDAQVSSLRLTYMEHVHAK